MTSSTTSFSDLPVGKPGVAACLSFADTRANVETWLGIFNYFHDNYDVKEATFTVYATGESEGLRQVWRQASTKPQLFTLRVNDLLPDYAGNLLLTCEMQGGRPTPPILQTYKAFRFPDGSVTSQHAEGPVARSGTQTVEHWGYDLEPGYDDIEFIFQNHSLTQRDEVFLEFFDASGKTLNASFETSLAPLGWQCVRLHEAMPAVRKAMADGRLTARIKHKINPQRPLYRIHHGGKFVLSHASSTTDTPATKPVGQIARYPVADDFLGEIYLVLPLDGGDEISAFVDNFYYPIQTYNLVVQVFDQQGKTVGLDHAFASVPPQGVAEIAPNDVRKKFGLDAGFKGHAILAIGPAADGLSPRGRISQIARVNGRKTGAMMNGGYVMNTQGTPGDRGLGAKRNRTFTPVWNDSNIRTEMMLFNNSSFTDYRTDAAYQLRLFGKDGEVASQACTIGGAQLQRVDMTQLASQTGAAQEPLLWAEVRSLEAQIPGIYLHRSSGWTDFDHMFGG